MFGTVADTVRRSTVHVRGGGSGILWKPGLILTNAHVARRERYRVDLWDGRTFDAAVVKRDAGRDLALLQIPAADAPAAQTGDSSALRPGQIVIAVGNPLGFIGALSKGVVHAQNRRWIQADIRLAPGNSGGPLADAEGRVVGINTMIAGGLAYAIPINAAAAFANSAARPVLGIVLQPVRGGLLVLEVEPGSPAAQASLLQGDLLIGFESPDALRDAIESSEVLLLRFVRGGQSRVREVAVRLRSAAA